MDLQFLLRSGRLGLTACPSETFQSAMLNAKLLLHVVIAGVLFLKEYPISPAGRNQPYSWESAVAVSIFPRQEAGSCHSFSLLTIEKCISLTSVLPFCTISLKKVGRGLMDARILHRLNSAIAGTPVTLFTQIYRPAQPQASRGRGKPVTCPSVSVKRSIIVF